MNQEAVQYPTVEKTVYIPLKVMYTCIIIHEEIIKTRGDF